MLKDKRIVLFDVDGTLIESVGIWNQVDGELIRRLGGTPGGEAEVQARRDTKLREFASAPDAYLEYCRYLGGFSLCKFSHCISLYSSINSSYSILSVSMRSTFKCFPS